MSYKKGDILLVHAYKHNGDLYRSWKSSTILDENDNYLITINDINTIVTEINGRTWKTIEPAIWFFSKKNWFNIIAILKNNEISYYVNLASPVVIEEWTIKYVDYELDIKVFPDYSYKILDLKEFNRNRLEWNYPKKIIDLIWNNVDNLKKQIEEKKDVFNKEIILKYFEQAKDI